MASVSNSICHPLTTFLFSLFAFPSSQTGGIPHLSRHITWLQSEPALADKLEQFMRAGDQCRGGKAGAKCQQMDPEVVQDYSLAWGVKQKESPVPRGRRNIHTNTLFLLSFHQQRLHVMERQRKKILAANCLLILEAFQPRAYPRINSLLSTSCGRKKNYMYSRKWVRFV